ncbi:hypothetical protein B0O80DRAFT_430459 [Mortierella sp. GBAus27b]|nr:hypothetical protein B0O80DRAFT_430459 [Mortierella sp. GBAus27b]
MTVPLPLPTFLVLPLFSFPQPIPQPLKNRVQYPNTTSCIVTSPRGNLSPVQSLRLAKAYLECATKEQDMDVALVLCHDTEVSLAQAKRSAKSSDHQVLHPEIAKAYVNLGHLLHTRGRPSEAKASYKKAEKLGVQVGEPGQPSSHSRPNSIISALSFVNTIFLDPSVNPPPTATQNIQRRDIANVPANVIFENARPPSLEFKLPEPDEHLINTPQLAGCLGILQATRSPGDILDPDVRKWLQSIEKNIDEQDRLKAMAKDVVRAFKRDEIKDAKAVAEVVYLAPVLDKDAFRDLLNTFYVGIGQSGLLDFHQLDGIAYLIQGADNGHLEADDLVKILGLLRTRLTETHRQSPEHISRLTITVSHVLDAMADTKVKDVDRVDLHEPLSAYLSGLQGSSDPYMVYQAAYACQALLCVPDDETPWQAAMRRTGKVVRGVSGLVSAVKGLDLNKLIDGLGDIQQGLAGASEIVGIVKTAYEGVASLAEGGQTFMKCLKEGLSFDRKRAWYSVLRGADALIRDGELSTFKELVCEAPCRRDLAFQWGVCQRLGEIASNPMWSADSRQSAIAFLGEMYRNDAMWGQHAPVKQLIINTLMQLGSASGSGLQPVDN